ncbi:TonB-dependent receptor [Govanella unica]|uniref:TonB-dependent receptor n=1 Tax=Govanella unica TaxID=2975056 RepID=A0A9X3Z763_9PROT|nr:TonB-dependent receptor [Govania unica]MDA5193831.1 TonB-dependent receptor [Govania unica]
MTQTIKHLLGTVAMVYGLCPYVATAAETPAASGAMLEEITVTARKLSENLQRTPVSVTVVSEKMIDTLSITNIGEVERLAPNVQFSQGFSGSSAGANFFIRGIGQLDFVATSDPGVGVFVDGVYMARTVGGALDTADIAQIEVLKGPQGTLFGKNTIGGAINIITKKPDENLKVMAEITVGNLGRTDGRFMANVPITDQLFVKITGSARHNDGFQTRLIDGIKLGDDNTISGGIQIRYAPAADFDIILAADVTKRRAHIAAQGLTEVATVGGGRELFLELTGLDIANYPPAAEPWKYSTSGVRPTDKLNIFGTSLTVNKDFGPVTLKSITAYRKLDADTATDFDGQPVVYNDQLVQDKQHQFSQEFQLSHQSEKLKWVLGAYYFNEHNEESIQNNFYVFWLVAPYGDGPLSHTELKTNNFAAYGQGSYKITPELSLTAGLRWTYEKKSTDIISPIGLGTLSAFNNSGGHHWSAVNPRLGIEYQATEEALLYATYTGGFKSGSFNGRVDRQFDAGKFQPYDPEKVIAWEGGFKTQWFDNRLRANAAAFLTHYKGIQLVSGATDAFGNLYFPTTNAGNLNIKGFEAELLARPIEMLNVYANLGYADEKWTSIYPSPFPTVSKKSRLPMFSHWTVIAGGDLTLPLDSFGSVMIGGNYSYRSAYFADTGNSPRVKQGGFGIFDAHLIVEPENTRWQLKFWGKNLTNKHYMTWGQDLIAIGDSHAMAFWGRPREFGATFSINM